MRSPLTAPPPRTAGQGVDHRRTDFLIDGIAMYYFGPAILWAMALAEGLAMIRDQPRSPGIHGMVALVGTVIGGFGLRRVRRKAAELKLGRDGEREVGHLLSTLDIPGVRIFHDIPADGFNLDHVVVCNRGIYVIETKTWSKPDKGEACITVRDGRINRNGWITDEPVRQAMRQADWLAGRLRETTGRRFRCQPAVVKPGWYVKEPLDAGTKAQAWVLNPTRLLGYIHNDAVRLAPEDVHLVADRLGALARKEDLSAGWIDPASRLTAKR